MSDDIEDDCRSVFVHAFILNESISQDLNIHNWNKKDIISFDTSVDQGYMGLFSSPKGLEEFKEIMLNKKTVELLIKNFHLKAHLFLD